MSHPPIWGERFLFMGKPKTGKSEMAASFPEPHLLNLDGAANGKVLPESKRTDIYDLDQFRQALEDVKRKPWQTLIADPIDRLVTWINREVVREYNKEAKKKIASFAEIGYGIGWDRQITTWNDILDLFWATAESRRPGLAASVLVAWCKNSEKSGETLVFREALAAAVQGSVNYIGYVFKTSGKDYFVDFAGSGSVEAGCRTDDSTNVMIETGNIRVPRRHGYDALVALFKPAEPTTAEIVKALNWLESKGGISTEKFLAWAKDMPSTARFNKIRELKAQPDELAKMKEMLK